MKTIKTFMVHLLAVCWIVLVISGMAMFSSPHGAGVAGWKFLYLRKSTWILIHMNFAILFNTLVFIHIVQRWKTLWSRYSQFTKVIALIVVFLMLSLTVLRVFPFNKTLDIRKSMRNQYSSGKL
jgi:magnesium-transporting ATPase (P-type)